MVVGGVVVAGGCCWVSPGALGAESTGVIAGASPRNAMESWAVLSAYTWNSDTNSPVNPLGRVPSDTTVPRNR